MKTKSIWFSLLFLMAVYVNALPPVHKTEARLLWVSRWMYSNENDVRTIVRDAKATGFNILLFQVRGNGTAFYKSSFEPMDEQIGGDTATWDPLAVAVDEAKKQGIQIHAWVNVYPGWHGKTPPTDPKQLWNAHRDWFCVKQNGKTMDLGDEYEVLSPGIPAVQDYLYNVFMEIVNKYDIDGLHFDYVRYYGSEYSYDSISLARFKEQYHATPSAKPGAWDDFRRQQVTDLVRRVYNGIKQVKPKVALSASVWGDWQEGHDDYFQDSHGWLSQGIIDFICPMEYTKSVKVYDNWTMTHMMNTHGRYIYPGIGIYEMKTPDIMLREMDINKKYPNLDGTVGYTFFDWSGLYEKDSVTGKWIPNSLQKTLANNIFKEPANVPMMVWKNNGNDNFAGPQITNLRTEPKIIRAGEPFRVFAKINDSAGLAEESSNRKNVTFVYTDMPFAPKLKWFPMQGLLIGLDKPPKGLFGMKQISDTDFVTESLIPGLKEGTEVYYKVAAADTQENVNDSELAHFSVYYPSLPYHYQGEWGQPLDVAQFAALDKENKIWVCEVGKNDLRVFEPNGSESPLSRISTGLNQDKKSVPLKNPSGIAAYKGMMYVTFGHDSIGYITEYDSANAHPVRGWDINYYPGDIAIDENGNLFVIEKLHGRWHLYDKLGREYKNSPFSYDTEASLINRGIAVKENGKTVYVASESSGEVVKFTGSFSRDRASFQPSKKATGITGVPGAVNLDKDGNLYVSDYDANCVKVFSRNEKHIADLIDGTSPSLHPRGVAFTPDGKTLYIVNMSGRLQKWVKEK